MLNKPTLAVFKFASCDGCQLSLLAAEDQLLDIAASVRIAYFLEASSEIMDGPYDIGLVEGSITTPHDAQRIKEVRRQCKRLVAIGACATAGGIQALRNWSAKGEFAANVYARPKDIDALATSTPIAEHVLVDFELRGCPISKQQLLSVLTDLLKGRRPRLPEYSVCIECKRRQTVCVAVTRGVACLGPLTQAGCGAICPAFGRECFGCFGPQTTVNATSLMGYYADRGIPRDRLQRLMCSFNGDAFGKRNDGTSDDTDRMPKRREPSETDDPPRQES